MWMEEPLDKRLNVRRVEEIIKANVDLVATACPYCLSMFEDGLKAKEVEELCPILHETYRRIGMFHKNRTARNEQLVLDQLEAAAPLLAFFRSYVPGRKQPYFLALSDNSLPISDRIVALDVAVGGNHKHPRRGVFLLSLTPA